MTEQQPPEEGELEGWAFDSSRNAYYRGSHTDQQWMAPDTFVERLQAVLRQERAARQAAGARLARFQTAYLAGKPDVLESFCFYCEATYPYGKEVDLEHITACQKHPVVALLAERDALREQLARLKTELEHYETTEEIEELLK